MRFSLFLLGLFACGSQPEPGFFGDLANNAIEQFDSLCHEYKGGHAVRDPTLKQAQFTAAGQQRVHADKAESFICDAGDAGVIAFDRDTRELLLLDMLIREQDVYLAQDLLRPTLTLWEQVGLLGEIQHLRSEHEWDTHHGFFDGRVTVSVLYYGEDKGIRYVHVMALPRIVEDKKS